MDELDYTSLAPEELLRPRPQHLIAATTSYLNITYANPVGWRPLTLDLHLPRYHNGPFPLVIYVHGGSFLAGIKAMGPWLALPAMGIAVASISYRLSGEAAFPAAIEDVRASVRWARANAPGFNVIPESIALWGSSAGAYLATMAGFSGSRPIGRPIGDHQEISADVAAIINHYGISDFAKLREDAMDSTGRETVMLEAAIRQFLGFDPLSESNQLLSTQPLELTRNQGAIPPIFIVHGDNDHRVGQGQSLRLHNGLIEMGHDSTFVSVPGADHADEAFSGRSVLQSSVLFLKSTWDNSSRVAAVMP